MEQQRATQEERPDLIPITRPTRTRHRLSRNAIRSSTCDSFRWLVLPCMSPPLQVVAELNRSFRVGAQPSCM